MFIHGERERIHYLQEVRSRLELEYEGLLNRGEYALAMVVSDAGEGLDAEINRALAELGDCEGEGPDEDPRDPPPGF